MNLRRSSILVSIFLLLCAFLFESCKPRERESPTKAAATHQITREFAEAARKSTPAGTVIRIKFATSADLPDRVDVTLFGDGNLNGRKALTARVLLSLATVAKRHSLETSERNDQGDSSSISFRAGSFTTHSIEIRFPRQTIPAPPEKQGAELSRLAIILDDLGSDRASAEAIFMMPYPLTISVLPNHEHSKEIAEEALERGYQVMLHLPMQSVANEAPEKEELRRGMTAEQVEAMLEGMIDSIPNAVGVNNHQGSEATSDPILMEELMPALRRKNLFYIDSRTTAATVAFDAAKKAGVPSAFRNVPFLDDVQDIGAIRKQLLLALRGAKEKKGAIAIGHPHAATLEALREFLPTVRASGVQLVFVSELAH